MMRSALFLLLVSIFFHGCISKHSGGMTEESKIWYKGVTTKREVVSAWGNPDSIRNDVWVWRESRLKGGKVRASYYRIGITIARSNIATYEHHLRFDENGKLLSHEIVGACENGAKWSLIPWDIN